MRYCPYSLRHVGITGASKDIDRHVPDDGYVLRRLLCSDFADVFFECHVLRIVQRVLYAPMTPDAFTEIRCRRIVR